mgnify:CR=1 FL=1
MNSDKSITGYDPSWYISEGWPGLYPARFTVFKKSIVLHGRAEMNLASPKVLVCPMPELATYSPWNAERKHNDKLRFVTASKIMTLTMQEAIVIETESWLGEDPISLDLQEGDVLQHLVSRGDNQIFREIDILKRAVQDQFAL